MLRRNLGRLVFRLGNRAGWLTFVLAATACLSTVGAGSLRSAPADQDQARTGPKSQPAVDSRGDALPAGALARLGTTRLRHGGDVTFIAFGRDGKTLVTAAQDGTIRVWDLA